MKDFRNITLSGIICSRPQKSTSPDGEPCLMFSVRSEIEFGSVTTTCYAKINEFSERDLQQGRWMVFCGRLGIEDQFKVDFYRTFEIRRPQQHPVSGETGLTEYVPPVEEEPEIGNRAEEPPAPVKKRGLFGGWSRKD